MIPLEFLRALQEEYLPDTCSISRATDTSTSDGLSQSWANVATGVSCRVSPLASSAAEALGASAGLEAVSLWTVWLPALTDVTTRDRIVYGARTFEVARVGARSYETARECICREVS